MFVLNAGASSQHKRLNVRFFENLRHQLDDSGNASHNILIEATFREMTEQFFIVSLLPKKQGKRQRREDVIELLRRYLPENIKISANDLLLPALTRWSIMVALLLLGLAALLAPATTLA